MDMDGFWICKGDGSCVKNIREHDQQLPPGPWPLGFVQRKTCCKFIMFFFFCPFDLSLDNTLF